MTHRLGFNRRTVLAGLGGLAFSAAAPGVTFAQTAAQPFKVWVEKFRTRARARGISDEVYTRVFAQVTPDTSVYAADKAQPEFQEEVWQYLNRRVSDWRISTGQQKAREYAALFGRIEETFGVDRRIMLGYWGMESAFGQVVENPQHMKPVFNSLSALAWGEPRRRKYWETELLNALVIVQRGWGTPQEMVGSWAGAMGHTQWMPEVWLNMGVDFDGNGRISPFGKPDDALAGTANYLVKRGKYRAGEPWGFEARVPASFNADLADNRTWRPLSAWAEQGVTLVDGRTIAAYDEKARMWLPGGPGGPALLLLHNFYAVRSYNPSSSYALAVCYLGDRIMGEGAFVTPWPGGERAMTLAELQEIQTRLTARGFPTGGTDGRVGSGTMRAVKAFQEQAGITPADGYPGLKVLNALRGR
ncbi:lytic murein transglycosylase [Aquabacter sp. L1I39]|uniref:lytic murein transglycosylase n=1 Tax=Aquabacter sp. L1I39 TaxID=2820278 RepID=UPI001AD9DD10|nr:lytic murein transglycosylase [Aquabacter sp. L1I39]QTL01559.1 lytic murein transglycosylase [Aquabacter sp. L1I39]